MREAGARLSGQDGSADAGGRGGVDGCLEGLRGAIAELHSSSERGIAQVVQIHACGARLREEVSATRQSFSVGALFAETVSRARGMLQEIGERDYPGSTHEGSAAAGVDLTDFTRHYTMQAEHDVHADAIGMAAAVATEQTEAPPREGQDLGDNVEFF